MKMITTIQLPPPIIIDSIPMQYCMRCNTQWQPQGGDYADCPACHSHRVVGWDEPCTPYQMPQSQTAFIYDV